MQFNKLNNYNGFTAPIPKTQAQIETKLKAVIACERESHALFTNMLQVN